MRYKLLHKLVSPLPLKKKKSHIYYTTQKTTTDVSAGIEIVCVYKNQLTCSL